MVDRVGVEQAAESQGLTRVMPSSFPCPGSTVLTARGRPGEGMRELSKETDKMVLVFPRPLQWPEGESRHTCEQIAGE